MLVMQVLIQFADNGGIHSGSLIKGNARVYYLPAGHFSSENCLFIKWILSS